MRLFTRTFTLFALSYLVLAAHGAASFLPSSEIFFSAGWQDAYTAAGQRYVFTDELGSVLSVPLPANTSRVAYASVKLAEEGTYAFCIDCQDTTNATVVDIRGAHHQNDSTVQPVTLFETDLDPTVQHLFSLFNVHLVDHSRVAFVSLSVTWLDNRTTHDSSSTRTLDSSTPVVTAISESILSTVTTTLTITGAAPSSESSSTITATLSSGTIPQSTLLRALTSTPI
ncbi:hypothetical protein CYLTODRAFT_6435 [Cylindrobasidium torrendii FP15055 ss-10]|uniref:Uncharacterized protein n=1 Tax=Cylindrobasidium torrendii FP15055 ss-10 TaxID=1314674 RepID=A0A0D7BRI0_9AGAR|nr:hypothetical protein CYLTODRAFT_6435 [Cylindrobasidium torrendii FP15055 ss-10]